MGFIYLATSPSVKTYVGQTIRNIDERFKEHQKEYSGCPAFAAAIKKHGWENFIIDYYECPDDELDKHETWLIRLMGTLAPGGYNLKEGGSHGKHSEESKKKLSDSNTGKIRTEETKKKISEAQIGEKNHQYGKIGKLHHNYGKTLSEETKKKLSEAKLGEKHHMHGKQLSKETKNRMSESKIGENCYWYGKQHTEETKKKISNVHLGKQLSTETKNKISEAMSGEKHHASKKVYQYDISGKYIQYFGSCREAERSLGKKSCNITACARGEKKSAYGFYWSYV